MKKNIKINYFKIILLPFDIAINAFLDIFDYLISRITILIVLLQTTVEEFSSNTLFIKRKFIRMLFWGRGNSFRYLTQIMFFGIFGFVILLSTYKPQIQDMSSTQYSSILRNVAQRDLIVDTGSLETLIPEERIVIEMKEYTVQKNDSLSSIATQFNLSIDSIKWANNIKNANQIKQGMVLKIPPGDGVMHKVITGDTLESVAKKYKVATQAIADVNWLDKNFNLIVGQEVFVPDATMPQDKPSKPNTPYVPPKSNGTKFLKWPVAGSSWFVSQNPSWSHVAIDIADHSYPDVLAAASGKVLFSGWKSSYGWCIQIDHGTINGVRYTTMYAHLNELYVSSGEYVNQGTPVGQLGSSGYSTGPHLHFELRDGLEYRDTINPWPYF